MTVAHTHTHSYAVSHFRRFPLFDKHSDQAEVQNETEAVAFTASWGYSRYGVVKSSSTTCGFTSV